MQGTEVVIVKVVQPSERKARWLETMAELFSQSVQLALDAAEALHTSSRTQIHHASYYPIRNQYGLAADYARMAVNAAVSLARSYYGLRQSEQQRQPSFPTINRSQGIGLGVNAYTLVERARGWVLRVSTGTRGEYIWLPLCVPARFRDRMPLIYGDAKLFKREGNWYAMLPVRAPNTPAVRDGAPTFIGVDLGIVRLATVATPDQVRFISGKAARHKREHFADLRRRYQRANRLDRVKEQRGQEQCWMGDLNHQISRQIIDLALAYAHPVICLERLDGIRNRTRGSKRFNRMMSSWSFRQLTDFIRYKAAREGIPVLLVDPRGTSKTCPRCGHATRSNRPQQGRFRCVACGYEANADLVAARNIAARGARLYGQEPPDTARSKEQTGSKGFRPDVVQGDASASSNHNLASSS